MKREQVARNQRARLYGGMIESVARRGYHATTIAEIIALAGVSRRTFYEHFDNKEVCLLATHNSIVGHVHKGVIAACNSQRGWTNRLHASCKSIFEEVQKRPTYAHFVLIDSLGIRPGAVKRMELVNLAFERLLHVALSAQSSDSHLPLLSARAIVGGVRHIVFEHVREHREPELYTLADDVLDWIESYRLPRKAKLVLRPCSVTDVPQRPADFLTRKDSQARILAATVQLIRDSGYASVTDSQLAKTARLPTQALHKQFPNKEACFLQAIETFINEALTLVEAEMRRAHSWPTEVHRAMNVYVEYLVSHRAFIQLAFVDLFDLGPVVVEHLTRSVEEFTKLLTDSGPLPPSGGLVAREAITGAIWAIIFSYASYRSISQLPALVNELTCIVLAPYIGARVSIELIGKSAGRSVRRGHNSEPERRVHCSAGASDRELRAARS
ncbi:MAG TPA: TetR/AcrR family transcriptional regulator [Solirubrobacteraceae bacterium]|jgi:AcrR family transcriptional regulator|nr:TetR/AcrR family transcriptional regulator [Solirubrobacteraceae bacterium]